MLSSDTVSSDSSGSDVNDVRKNQLQLMKENCALRLQVVELTEQTTLQAEEIAKLKQIMSNHNIPIDEFWNNKENKADTMKDITADDLETLIVELEDSKMLNVELTQTNKNLWDRYKELDSKMSEMDDKYRSMVTELKDLSVENNELDQLNQKLLNENEALVTKVKKLQTMYGSPVIPGTDKISRNPEVEKLPFYHGFLGRKNAELMLGTAEEGDFLLRNCEMNLTYFTLSVRVRNNVRHFLIRQEGQYLLIGNQSFTRWTSLIEYFCTRPIVHHGSIHVKLNQPLYLETVNDC